VAGAVRVAAGVNGMGCCFCTSSRPACGSPRCALPHFPVRWGASWSESSHPTCMRCLGWFKIGCWQGPLGCEVLLKLLFFACPVYVLLLLLLFLSLCAPSQPFGGALHGGGSYSPAGAGFAGDASRKHGNYVVGSISHGRTCLPACLPARLLPTSCWPVKLLLPRASWQPQTRCCAHRLVPAASSLGVAASAAAHRQCVACAVGWAPRLSTASLSVCVSCCLQVHTRRYRRGCRALPAATLSAWPARASPQVSSAAAGTPAGGTGGTAAAAAAAAVVALMDPVAVMRLGSRL
jgi:hypothetical protein